MDIACGKGIYAAYQAAGNGAKSAYRFDLNEEMVKITKNLFPSLLRICDPISLIARYVDFEPSFSIIFLNIVAMYLD